MSEGPRLARIAVHPIKALDPATRDRARVGTAGGLDADREYAVVDADGDYVNGKRTADVHRIRASYTDDLDAVSLRRESDSADATTEFALPDDRDAIAEWLTDYFGYPVSLARDSAGGMPDDTTLSGPTVISTATLETVADWFDGLSAHQLRLRTRANLEIGGVPAFWEGRLVSDFDHAVAVRIGDVTLCGVNPCQRCVVPSRDPYTGEEYRDFRRIFVENRERTLPDWVDDTRFDHYFRLMVNTLVSESEWEETVAVGDDVEILGERALDAITG
jgi:uncharacterized protein YcbX